MTFKSGNSWSLLKAHVHLQETVKHLPHFICMAAFSECVDKYVNNDAMKKCHSFLFCTGGNFRQPRRIRSNINNLCNQIATYVPPPVRASGDWHMNIEVFKHWSKE